MYTAEKEFSMILVELKDICLFLFDLPSYQHSVIIGNISLYKQEMGEVDLESHNS